MSSNEELSPEEKLLKVIQQRKEKQSGPPVETPAAPSPGTPPPGAPANTPEPPPAAPERKLKLAPPPVEQDKAPLARQSLVAEEPSSTAHSADNVSPVVEAPVTAAPAAEPVAAQVSVPPEMRPDSGGWNGVFVRGLPKMGRRQSVGIVVVNRYLSLIVLVLFVLVVYFTVSWKSETMMGIGTAGAVEVATIPKVPAVTPLPAVGEFTEAFAKRNIWVGKAKNEAGTNIVAQEEIKDLKLLGVSWEPDSEEMSEALIRDEKTKRTHFVKTGQAIGETGFVAGKISRNRVTVIREGKETELR